MCSNTLYYLFVTFLSYLERDFVFIHSCVKGRKIEGRNMIRYVTPGGGYHYSIELDFTLWIDRDAKCTT